MVIQFAIKFQFVLLFLLSFHAAAQFVPPIFDPAAPPTLSNLSVGQVAEGQAISVSINVTANQNRIVSVTLSTRADGTGTTAFSSAGALQRVGTTSAFQGAISSRPYGGYTLRVSVLYESLLQISPNPLNPPVQRTTRTEKVFIVSAGANCFAFDQAGASEGWSGTPLRVHNTNATFGACVANPLQDSSGNWPFNVANSGRGGLSDTGTIVDICDPISAQPDSAFWRTEYVSPDLTTRAEFQNATEIVVRVRANALFRAPFIQVQAQLSDGSFRFPKNGAGTAVFVTLGQNLDTGVTSNGRLRNTFDQATGWNVIALATDFGADSGGGASTHPLPGHFPKHS